MSIRGGFARRTPANPVVDDFVLLRLRVGPVCWACEPFFVLGYSQRGWHRGSIIGANAAQVSLHQETCMMVSGMPRRAERTNGKHSLLSTADHRQTLMSRIRCKTWFAALALAGVFFAAFATAPSAIGQLVLTPVVISGQSNVGGVPGATWGYAGVPTINFAGTIAIQDNLIIGPGGVVGEQSSGLWTGRPGNLISRARGGTSSPGTVPGSRFDKFSPPAINAAGTLSFAATTTQETQFNSGVWTIDPSGVHPIAPPGGTSVNEAGGSVSWSVAGNSPGINDDGRTVFRTSASGGLFQDSWWTGSPGTAAKIAESGRQAWGLPAGVLFDVNLNSGQSVVPTLNTPGSLLYSGWLRCTQHYLEGICLL
jgi:hypothetical protein